MKDTLITAEQKRRELIAAGVCLGLAVLVNLGSIIYFHTPWYELFTQIGFTLCVALFFYVIYMVIRLIIKLFRKK